MSTPTVDSRLEAGPRLSNRSGTWLKSPSGHARNSLSKLSLEPISPLTFSLSLLFLSLFSFSSSSLFNLSSATNSSHLNLQSIPLYKHSTFTSTAFVFPSLPPTSSGSCFTQRRFLSLAPLHTPPSLSLFCQQITQSKVVAYLQTSESQKRGAQHSSIFSLSLHSSSPSPEREFFESVQRP